MSARGRLLLLTGVVVVAVAGAWAYQATRPQPPRFVRQIPWTGQGVWLRADLHAHTRFSDGGHTPEELVAKAQEFGCDVSAITDHSDGDLKAATPEYLAAIAAARQAHPQLTVVTGLEWNIPPGKGNDHVTTLVPPALEDLALLAEFKTRFDDLNKEGENPELADEALRWMAARAGSTKGPVYFLNHPSRKVKVSAEVLPWLQRWHAVSPMFLGMEGAPGHQHQDPLGAYGRAVKLIDRWDPVTADVGGIWDQLLASGLDLWGTSATSDFHSWANGDYWPCQFSETRIYARDRSIDAVLDALRAGSFFGVHGRVVSDAALTLAAEGLPRDATPGEVVRVSAGREVRVALSATAPESDWEGKPNRLDRLEIIAVDSSGARVAAAATTTPATVIPATTLIVPPGGLTVRARGCRGVVGAPGLCFYTNAIRVVTRR